MALFRVKHLNKTYKVKSTIDISINGTKPKDMKLTLLSNYLYGTDFLNSDKNNNDNNLSANQFNHFNLDDEEGSREIMESMTKFENSLSRLTKRVLLNPMDYTDKTLVSYKDPTVQHYNAPYFSAYSGMMFNSYC